ncbi:phophatidylserine decarboxylase associated domain-containing protein [Corallococcus exiguus]|nr:phophatidylserine decarboxylase associated domain-containing protein [Corallococcus exiguus]
MKRPENDFLRIYIGSMLDAANQKNPLNIKTPADFVQQLDNALYSLPKYDANFMAALPFYTVLQPFMENGPGWAFFTNEGIRPYFSAILKAYHDKLETPASLAYMNDSYGNWLSADAREYLSLDDYVYSPSAPHGGFKSWGADRPDALQLPPVALAGDWPDQEGADGPRLLLRAAGTAAGLRVVVPLPQPRQHPDGSLHRVRESGHRRGRHGLRGADGGVLVRGDGQGG